MSNVIDYIEWRGDLSFNQSEFNEVDSLILSKLSYVIFDEILKEITENNKITIAEANRRFHDRYCEDDITNMYSFSRYGVTILEKMSSSKRFANLKIKHYINSIDYENISQFSAMIIEIDDEKDFISFSGTDNTVVGWVEDFTMSYLAPVPAQLKAVKYINEFGKGYKKLILGGHSKGGNLAVYAATKCELSIKSKILKVYNNDGPGFTSEFISSGDYLDIHERVDTIIPESSLIGIIFEHEENYKVVKSNKTAFLQHNSLSWEVLGNSFVYLGETSKFSQHIDKTLKSWMKSLSEEEKTEFVNALYDIFEYVDAKTVDDALTDKWATLMAFKDLNEDTRKMLFKVIGQLINENNKIVKEGLFKKTL